MTVPLVSIIVPAFNAEATIIKLIDSIAGQTYPADRLELLIIDDGSTDTTRELVLSRMNPAPSPGRPAIRFFNQANRGPSTARNLGLQEARGDLVTFTDADCIAAPDWTATLVRHFIDPTVIGAGGRQDCPPDACPFMREVHATLGLTGFVGGYIKSARQVSETGHNPSCTSMYRRTQLLQVGGFREGLFPGEDVDLDRRLATAFPGTRILYDPAAVVFHYRPDSYRRWARMMWRYGCSNAWNVHLHGYFRFSQRLPWLVVAGMALTTGLLGWQRSQADRRLPWVALAASGIILGFLDRATGNRVSSRGLLLCIMVVAYTTGFFHALRSGLPAGIPAESQNSRARFHT